MFVLRGVRRVVVRAPLPGKQTGGEVSRASERHADIFYPEARYALNQIHKATAILAHDIKTHATNVARHTETQKAHARAAITTKLKEHA